MSAWLKILLLSSVTLTFLIVDISASLWFSAVVTLVCFLAALIWVVRREHKPSYSPIIEENQQAAVQPQNSRHSHEDGHPTGH